MKQRKSPHHELLAVKFSEGLEYIPFVLRLILPVCLSAYLPINKHTTDIARISDHFGY